jgi:hypothetical protein
MVREYVNAYRFWWGNVKEKGQTEKLCDKREHNIRIYLKKSDRGLWTRFVWLRIGKNNQIYKTRGMY